MIVGACRDEVQLWEVMQGAPFAPADEATLLAEMHQVCGSGDSLCFVACLPHPRAWRSFGSPAHALPLHEEIV